MHTPSTDQRRLAAFAVSAATAAAVTLTGCDSGGTSSGDAAPAHSTSPAPSSTPGPTQGSSPAPTSPAGSTGTALSAIATAQKAVAGGKLFDLESDTRQGRHVWEAKVADPKGAQYNLDLTSDGGSVSARHQDPTPDDDIAKLRSATVPVGRAVHIAAGRAQGAGALSSLEIDTHRGSTVVWQVGFGGDDGTTVIVDAHSGRVLAAGRDAG